MSAQLDDPSSERRSICNDFTKLETLCSYLQNLKDKDEERQKSITFQIQNYKLIDLLKRLPELEVIVEEFIDLKYLKDLSLEHIWDIYSDIIP